MQARSNAKAVPLKFWIFQMACQELEFSMSRINNVVSRLMTSQGKNIEQDYGSLEALVTVLKNNLVMVSTIFGLIVNWLF